MTRSELQAACIDDAELSVVNLLVESLVVYQGSSVLWQPLLTLQQVSARQGCR